VVTRTTQLRARLATAAPVGGGLALVGAAAYAALALAGHSLPPGDYNAVASMYLLTAIVGPGVFTAVEQQTNREVSGRISVGVDSGPAVRAASLVSAGLAALIGLVVLALAPLLVGHVFAGHEALIAATVLAVFGAAAAYLLRGVFAGQQRYHWYGVSLAAEGLARLLPCGLLVLLGWVGANQFGFAFALGCGLAAAVTLPGLRRTPGAKLTGSTAGLTGSTAGLTDSTAGLTDSTVKLTGSTAGLTQLASGRPVRLGRLAGSVTLLALASGMTLLVANLGPVVLASRLGPAGAELAASFVSLFVLARIPVFLFAPVQAFLLPGLTSAAERRNAAQVRRQVRTALLAVAALGAVGIVGAGLLGPWASMVFFAAPTALSRLVATLLGASTVAMMAAQILQPALVALGRNRAATLAWAVSSAVFVGLLFAPTAPLTAAVAAQLAAPILVATLMAVTLHNGLRALDSPRGEGSAEGQSTDATVTNSL
jgi:O-antigen/teichoic acid export membrane protein